MLSTLLTARACVRHSGIFAVFFFGAAVMLVAPIAPQFIASKAQAQAGVSLIAEFQEALDPYGRWTRHPRWGDVWMPDVDPEWQPYTVGHWVYTDEWGWFWESDEDFGWIVYHYGRWVLDRDMGWIWLPGEVWGPAWVQWRQNPQHIGWAPLPPDDVIVEYEDVPDYWIFVGARDFAAPRISYVLLPRRDRVVFIRDTVIVNRTVFIDRGPRIAVNPGIEPRIVAAGIGRPIRVASVRPSVVRGTVGVQSAVFVQTDRRQRQAVRTQISERQETIEPADRVRRLEPLGRGERGRLGERPPTAAREQARRFDEPSDRQRFESPRGAGPGRQDDRRERDVTRERDPDSLRARRGAPEDATGPGRERPGQDRERFDARERSIEQDQDAKSRQRGEGWRDKNGGPEQRFQDRARPGIQPPGGAEQARPDRSLPNQIERGPDRPDRAMRQERLPDQQQMQRGPQMERGARPREEFGGRPNGNGPNGSGRERMQQGAPPSRAGPPPTSAPRTISPPSGPSGGGIERAPQPRGAPGRPDDRKRDQPPQ